MNNEITEEQDIDDLLEQAIADNLFQPGKVYFKDQIPNALYHRGPGISSTNIKNALISPLHYKTYKEHPKPSTPAMMLGTFLHELVLEPDTFDERFAMKPFDAPNRPTVKMLTDPKPKPEIIERIRFWNDFDEKNAGKTLISNSVTAGADPFWSPGMWDQIHLMRDAIMEHEYASMFLQNFNAEVSIYWMEKVAVRTQTGEQVDEINELCKARFDVHCLLHNVAADLKTAKDATYTGFLRAIIDFGYHISREHYMEGARQLGMELGEFFFLSIEKEPPYPIGVYRLDDKAKHVGRMLRTKGLEAIAAAHHFDEWPSYPPQDRVLKTPPWLERVKVI